MRNFNNFLRICAIVVLILNFFFLMKGIEARQKQIAISLEREVYVGVDPNGRLASRIGVITFTEPETTTTRPAETTTAAPETTKSTTSAPTVQQTKYEEDENGKYYWFNASCTAYCGCGKCCGKYAANRNWDENGQQIILTASGNRAVPKYTIAMSKNLKFGTKVYIEGIGMCEVMDRGGAVKGNVIDIYFGSHEEALNWGRRSIKVKIYV